MNPGWPLSSEGPAPTPNRSHSGSPHSPLQVLLAGKYLSVPRKNKEPSGAPGDQLGVCNLEITLFTSGFLRCSFSQLVSREEHCSQAVRPHQTPGFCVLQSQTQDWTRISLNSVVFPSVLPFISKCVMSSGDRCLGNTYCLFS